MQFVLLSIKKCLPLDDTKSNQRNQSIKVVEKNTPSKIHNEHNYFIMYCVHNYIYNVLLK